MLKPRL